MKVNDKNEKGEKDNMKWEYDKKVDTLIERIKWADAILVGAAAGMSASCWGNSIRNIGILALSTVSITGIRLLRHVGPFLPGCATWSMSVKQVDPILT